MISISMVDLRSVATRIGSRSRGRPHAVDAGDQRQREHRAKSRGLRRGRVTAIERDHHAGEQNHERQHPRQRANLSRIESSSGRRISEGVPVSVKRRCAR